MATVNVPGRRGRDQSLQGYAHFVRRNRVFVGGLAGAGALVGLGLVALSPAEFVATETVAVTPQPTGADLDPDRPSLVSLDSDAQVLSSGAVLSRAAASSGFPGGAGALADSLDVSALPNSRVLIIRVTSDDRDLAVAACTAVVDEFLTTRAATESARAEASAADLSTEIATLLDRLGALDGAVGDDEAAPAATELARQQLLVRLADLEDQLRIVTTAGTAPPGTITAPATAAGAARPMAAANVVTGLLGGLIVGSGIASVRESGIGRGGGHPIGGVGRARRRGFSAVDA